MTDPEDPAFYSNGNPKPGTAAAYAAGLEPVSDTQADGDPRFGRDPRAMTKEELKALGHEGVLLKAVRQNCLQCCCGNAAEVRRCHLVWCPMWPYRMGRNPFQRKRLARNRRKTAGRGWRPCGSVNPKIPKPYRENQGAPNERAVRADQPPDAQRGAG